MIARVLTAFFHNFAYKIAAFFLAALCWYLVQAEEVLEVNGQLEVNIFVADGYMLRGEKKRSKDITLLGPRALLAPYGQKPVVAHIVVPAGRTGVMRYRLDKDFVRGWNSRLRMTVHDAYLMLHVDEKISRTVNIKEHLQGIPAEGYIVERTTLEPKRVEVSGMRGTVSKLQHVLTESIDVTGLQRSQSFEVKLASSDDEQLEYSVPHVQAKIQIGEQKINKRFRSIPIEVETGSYATNMRPNFVSIVIQGTPGVLSFVKRQDLRAFVDVRDAEPGQHEKKVQVKIPADTALIETFPEHVLVDVSDRRARRPVKRSNGARRPGR